MWEIVRAGGPFMWPIIFCSIALVGIVLERLWTLQRKRVLPQDLIKKVSDLADNREAWQLDANGRWSPVTPRRGAKRRSAQSELLAKMREPDDQA